MIEAQNLKTAFLAGLAATVISAPALSAGIEKIMIFTPSARIVSVNNIADELKEESLKRGMICEFLESDGSAEVQINTLMAKKSASSGYVIRPVDGLDPRKLLDIVMPMKAPVVFVSTNVGKDVIDYYDNAWFVGTDSEDVARALANGVIDYIKSKPDSDRNKNGIIDITFMHGPKGHVEEEARYRILKEELAKNRINYRFVNEAYCDWFFEKAFYHFSNLLKEKRSYETDVVVSANDDMAMGVIEAYYQYMDDYHKNIDLPPVFGVDGTNEAMRAVKRGDLVSTVVRFNHNLTVTIFNILVGNSDYEALGKIAKTKVTSRTVYVAPVVVDSSNVKEYLKRK